MAISSEMRDARATFRRPIKHGRGFLVEALVVLAFLMVALAVFARLFSGAQIEGLRATRLNQAVQLATNYAEVFSADPTALPKQAAEDGLVVTCEVTPLESGLEDAPGTLYEATIRVSEIGGSDELYVLRTARYVDGAGAAGAGAASGGDAS